MSEDQEPKLVIEFDVPAHVTDDELTEVVGRLAVEADDLHRAAGGHGLKVESVEIYNMPDDGEGE